MRPSTEAVSHALHHLLAREARPACTVAALTHVHATMLIARACRERGEADAPPPLRAMPPAQQRGRVTLLHPIPSQLGGEGPACAQAVSAAEADSYWCLCKLLDGIQDHYTHAQPGIQRTVFRLKELVRRGAGAASSRMRRGTM